MIFPESEIDKVFILNIFIDENKNNPKIIKSYEKMINDRQEEIRYWISNAYGDKRYLVRDWAALVDSGFDLLCPDSCKISAGTLGAKINHGIKCSMAFNNQFCGYHLYPRSSMGTKTPLRLSNSVGIIDAGYRGCIMSVVDNHHSKDDYQINQGDRLTQICGANLLYPIWPQLVERESDLISTKRGDGGFGSTGK